ncbi:LLM class flavin-dependent oxidoreductase [Kitasatospora sp. NPDC058965]|uniref:LLM class flavin-dependent oxidoreductase n=1 Tax=Kitasatospora sp. NPDC058965 TaxID=3346682 RepID=UPI0036BEF700
MSGTGTLRPVELAEHLGFDSAWLTLPQTATAAPGPTPNQVPATAPAPHRSLAPLDVLAEAAAHTGRLALGAATLPLTGADPLGLAEELAALDRRSGARLNPAVALGADPATGDTDRDRAGELLDGLRKLAPGLAHRLWCAPADPHAARWAGEQGLNLLVGTDRGDATHRLALVRAFREAHPRGAWARVCHRLAVLPVDAATPTQRARYREYAEQSPALVGPAPELAHLLAADAAFREVEEAAFVLPDGFPPEDHAQLLTDLASRLAPLLGWQPVY